MACWHHWVPGGFIISTRARSALNFAPLNFKPPRFSASHFPSPSTRRRPIRSSFHRQPPPRPGPLASVSSRFYCLSARRCCLSACSIARLCGFLDFLFLGGGLL